MNKGSLENVPLRPIQSPIKSPLSVLYMPFHSSSMTLLTWTDTVNYLIINTSGVTIEAVQPMDKDLVDDRRMISIHRHINNCPEAASTSSHAHRL